MKNILVLKEWSLQHMAGVKIVSELWNQSDIKIEIAKIKVNSSNPIQIHPDDFKAVKNGLKTPSLENNIIEKVWALPLPTILKVNLLNLVRPIGSEIKSWWCYHNNLERLRIPNQLCWSPRGTVNYKKTAELIVKDENEHIETRYLMACTYCLVNEISMLWKCIPETRKKWFYYFELGYQEMDPWTADVGGDYRKHSVAFWTYNTSNRVTELNQCMLKTYKSRFDISSYRFAFEWAALGLNRAATEFFFEKLSSKEKNEDLVWVTCYMHDYPSILYSCLMETTLFLLNQLSEEQQEIVFQDKCFSILRNMLHWPYQTLFLDTAKKWSHYLSIYEYSQLFNKICDKIKTDIKEYDYRELLKEFWRLGSANYRTLFQNTYIFSNVIKLYDSNEEDLLKYVLKQTTEFQKGQLLSLKIYNCDDLSLVVDEKKLGFLKFLMSECITCKETIINFKKNLEIQHSTEVRAEYKVKLTKVLQLVDAIILNWK